MRLMKLALLIEVEIGCLWTLAVVGASDPEMASLFFFVLIYPFNLAIMTIGAISFFKRPATRPLAAAVFATPLVMLFVPYAVLSVWSGPGEHFALAWLLLPVLPLAVCLFLPHQAAEFMPAWALRSRLLHVAGVVLLCLMILGWIVVVPVVLALFGGGRGGGEGITTSLGEVSESAAASFVFVIVFSVLSALVAGCLFLASYVGLFQRVDRSQQKLRIAQVALSVALLVPSLPALGLSLMLLGVAMTNPG